MIDGWPDTVLSFCPNALRSLLIGAYIHEDVSTSVLGKKKTKPSCGFVINGSVWYAHGQGHNLYHNANICH